MTYNNVEQSSEENRNNNMEQLQQESTTNNVEQLQQESTSKNQQELPEEIRGENLPQEAQQIYAAALKAAKSDGISEEGARQIALNSVHEMFEKGLDGQWYAKGEVTAQHHKAVTSGGN
jgi:cation transport regulator